MKIGIIGKGTVGKAVYEGLQYLGNEMCFFDPAYEGSKLEDVLNAECVFISVPTNQAPNGDCDTSIVEKVINELNAAGYKGLVGIKSTVVPGTSEKLSAQYPNLRICSVPEFLRAKSALADFMYNHDLLVIGSNREEDFDMIKEIHGNLPKAVSCVKPAEAEVVKYFNNVNCNFLKMSHDKLYIQFSYFLAPTGALSEPNRSHPEQFGALLFVYI